MILFFLLPLTEAGQYFIGQRGVEVIRHFVQATVQIEWAPAWLRLNGNQPGNRLTCTSDRNFFTSRHTLLEPGAVSLRLMHVNSHKSTRMG